MFSLCSNKMYYQSYYMYGEFFYNFVFFFSFYYLLYVYSFFRFIIVFKSVFGSWNTATYKCFVFVCAFACYLTNLR